MNPLRWVAGWRLPLRLARRDALRHRGRSVLVLVMIALPVLAVSTADVLIATAQVSGVESLERRMGSAQALVQAQEGAGRVDQPPDPDDCCATFHGQGDEPMATAEQIGELLPSSRLLEMRNSEVQVASEKGRAPADATEVDLTDPLTEGLFDLTSGRWPQTQGEVVVNQALLDKGYAVGDALELYDGDTGAEKPGPTIVGVAESGRHRDFPSVAGPTGSLSLETQGYASWLVDGAPVTWAQVRALNEIGVTVASRAVITDPPPASEVPDSVESGAVDSAMLAVLVLIVVMALLEVVLLAGPAFAVGARKQQRSLALMAATGGTPVQSRRVILASAVVLGGAAALAGVLLGLGLAWLLQPLVQSLSGEWLGPYDVRWLDLAGVAAFGLLSAFLAAVVPASIASRQDVVAVLAGRRADRPLSVRSPVLGLVLLGAGVAGSAYGAVKGAGGELWIAASAIPAVLGMILLIPVALVVLGRLSRKLPVVLRYAVRDAARHRTRTVPAVAAVAATVAGVVALGIGVTSDDEQNERTYTATVTEGTGVVTKFGDIDWGTIRAVVEREAPGLDLTEVQGVVESGFAGQASYFFELVSDDGRPLLQGWSSSYGASTLVSDDALPPGLVGVSATDVRAARQALAAGRVIAFTDQPVDEPETQLTARVSTYDPETGEESTREGTVDAFLVPIDTGMVGLQAVLPTATAEELGVPVDTAALVTTGDITEDQERAVGEALAAISIDVSWYVERGYQADDETLIVQLVLLALGGVLVLGGTLTATFLALSDARPDLATLSAVGASPRTRRGVAASYAVVVGLVGALLGAAVGFIPGIAVSYPLTSQGYGVVYGDGSTQYNGGPFIDVPWLMILALVVALPLFTALVVGLFARSRLPMVARLD